MEKFFSIRKCINRKKEKVHLPQCKAKLFFAVIFQICGCSTHHSFEVLTNDPGAIQNKLPSTDKEYCVQLSGNSAQFLHENFVRSRFQLSISLWSFNPAPLLRIQGIQVN